MYWMLDRWHRKYEYLVVLVNVSFLHNVKADIAFHTEIDFLSLWYIAKTLEFGFSYKHLKVSDCYTLILQISIDSPFLVLHFFIARYKTKTKATRTNTAPNPWSQPSSIKQNMAKAFCFPRFAVSLAIVDCFGYY